MLCPNCKSVGFTGEKERRATYGGRWVMVAWCPSCGHKETIVEGSPTKTVTRPGRSHEVIEISDGSVSKRPGWWA